MRLSVKLLFAAAIVGFTHIARAQNTIISIAGNGITQYIGDGAPATNYSLGLPECVFVDRNGNIYVADDLNQRIRKITPGGTLSTVAGTGAAGYSGDNGPATDAKLERPQGIFLDTAGNMYITESYNNVVRKVTATTGIITTVCGNGGGLFAGDGGPATDAHLESPRAAVVDKAGNVYVPDYGNHRIRKVTAATGIINTIAGTGINGYSGDGGSATDAKLSYPTNLAIDTLGNLYFAEFGNNVVRKITASTGIITTIAGNGTNGTGGDGGPATAAQLNVPTGVFMDKNGVLYIADNGSEVVRAVSAGGYIFRVAGNGYPGYSGDGGPALNARMYGPNAVFVDNAGSLYISDGINSVVRKIANPTVIVNNVQAGTGATIYPNPSNGIFTISGLGRNGSLLEIYDVAGRLMLRNETNDATATADLSGAADGIYILRLHTAGNVTTVRILKTYQD